MEERVPMIHRQSLRWLTSLLSATVLLAGCATTVPEAPPAPTPTSVAEAPAAAASAPAAAASAPEAAAVETAQAEPTPVDPLRPDATVDLNDATAHADLWARLRKGFAMPDLDNELVRDR